jgi:uncharacterized protein (DUF2141 family)
MHQVRKQGMLCKEVWLSSKGWCTTADVDIAQGAVLVQAKPLAAVIDDITERAQADKLEVRRMARQCCGLLSH